MKLEAFVLLRHPQVTFNRTIKELKPLNINRLSLIYNAFNRTIKELKPLIAHVITEPVRSFNRTIKELKQLKNVKH